MTPDIKFVLTIGTQFITIAKTAEYRLVSYSGIEAADVILDIADNGSADGGYLQSERVGTRTITLAFKIDDKTRTEQLRAWLIKFFAPKQDATLTVTRTGVTRTINCKLAARPEFVQGNMMRDRLGVTVNLICPDPYFYDTAGTEQRFLTYTPVLNFPMTSIVNVGATSGILTVTDTITLVNDGDAPIGIVCDITASGGTVTNPKVTVNGGEYVKVLKAMARYTVVTVDTRERLKNIYVNNVAAFIFDRNSVFFSVPVGTNTIKISADTGLTNATATVSYALKYLGV
jgi:hypothetical protein